jgi:hypothetical protein
MEYRLLAVHCNAMSETDPFEGLDEDELRQTLASDGVELRRRLNAAAGVPLEAAARTPDPLPDMATALDRLHAARRAAGMRDLDEDEGIELGVRLAREAREELAALGQ